MTVAELKRRLFTVDEYERIVETGVLGPADRVELLRGEIVEMAAIGSRHAACVSALVELLHQTGPEALLRVQSPLRLDDLSEPEPDLALVRRRGDRYAHGHPTAADVLLLVEVSDTTLATDRAIKLPTYAGARIPEVWIVDLEHGCLLTFRHPGPEGYAEASEHGAEEVVSPTAFPDVRLPVADLLP
jgi:Uma2 family endonuclease